MRRINFNAWLVMPLFLLAMVLPAAGKTILVDYDAPGPLYDGSNWHTAFKYLQDGLSAASSGDEIQVAEGIYKPDQGFGFTAGNRTATFRLKNGVAIKGGYAGLGQPDPDARDIEVYQTVLSGDLLGNDGPDFANNDENSEHVVTSVETDATTVLDGFTITSGNAEKEYPSPFDEHGGGMFNGGSSPTVTDCTFSGNYAIFGGGMSNVSGSPKLTNCTFSGNWAKTGGGMLNEYNSNPTVTNCMFSGNVAKHSSGYGSGGGMYNSMSDPNLVNCTFNDNLAFEGGGVANSGSSLTLTNCTFSNNSVELGGGGMYNGGSNPTMTNCTFSDNSAEWGGGMCNDNNSNPTMTNCTFSDNSADNGGGMCNRRYFGYISSPTLTNCTFSNNSAENGGGMFNADGSPTLTNCTFIHNLASDFGGGMLNRDHSSPIVTHCTFSGNTVSSNVGYESGGGMCNDGSSPTVTNSTFNDNRAMWGGGMENENNSNPSLIGCTFKANSATMGGGAIRNRTSSPTVLNCLIVGNEAQYGAGIHNDNSGNPTLINCTFSSNSANYHGGGIVNYSSSPILNNCILWANSDHHGVDESAQIDGGFPAVNYCCIQGWTGNLAGIGNINADPWFVEPGYRDANGVWIDGDYHLHRVSSCINAGDNSAVPPSLSTDLDGNPRIAGGTVDIGVYEFWSPLILYVDRNASGANDGSSWANAYNDLQDALAVALSGDEIRVAQGIYFPEGPLLTDRQASNPNPPDGAGVSYLDTDLSWTPGAYATSHDVYFGTTSPGIFQGNQIATTFDPGTMAMGTKYYWRIDEVGPSGKTTGAIWSFTTFSPPPPPPLANSNEQAAPAVIHRETTFQLKNGVAIKGGYAGFDEPDPNARDVNIYKTILSGDLADNDGPNFTNNAENSFHVVTGSGTNATALLDGFTITGGNANGSLENGNGGGMYNWEGSPTVTNCTFTGNAAQTFGGGMLNRWDSSPTLNNCVFRGNLSDNHGGGMSNVTSTPTLTNCMFSGNRAVMAGGMFNFMRGDPTLTNCTFSGNIARWYGGGMRNKDWSSPTLTNCTFSRNAVTGLDGSGGAMRNVNWSCPTLNNCTFAANSATYGRALACGSYQQSEPSNLELTNCILWDGGDEIWNEDNSVFRITYSDVQGGWVGTGNINANPLFVDSAIDDYHLLPDSLCINAGDPDYIAEPDETDLDDKPRVIGGRIDMGAYEFNHVPVADVGPDQTVEAQAPWGATVTLDASGSSDADSTPGTIDDINDFNWYQLDPCDPNADIFLGSGRIVDCNLPIGEHIILLEVMDKAGALDVDEITIIVQDTTPPVFTNVPQNLTVLCDGSHNLGQLNAWLAGTPAVDECGDVTITNDFVGLLNGCGATGSVTVTWTAEDESGNTTTTPPATFTIVDTIPPVITCPPDVTLQCPADTSVEANGSASAGDTCSSVAIAHSDLWQPGCGNTGTLTRTWTATDDCGNSSSCLQTLTVVDTTPPEFEFSVAPTMLWPPDHKMVLITPSWTVSDECDASPEVSLVSIVANEGDDTIGDGHTSNDIQIGEDGSIYLRSERSGTSNDRIYTITYQAVDECGNTTVRSATVSIPHDFKVLARIASRWLWSGPGRIPEDLNGDGIVNLADFAKFAENWIR